MLLCVITRQAPGLADRKGRVLAETDKEARGWIRQLWQNGCISGAKEANASLSSLALATWTHLACRRSKHVDGFNCFDRKQCIAGERVASLTLISIALAHWTAAACGEIKPVVGQVGCLARTKAGCLWSDMIDLQPDVLKRDTHEVGGGCSCDIEALWGN